MLVERMCPEVRTPLIQQSLALDASVRAIRSRRDSTRSSRARSGPSRASGVEACQRRQPVLLLLRTKMYEIASGCKKSVGVE
jgi:hypothetical protein